GFNDSFLAPHSRHTEVRREDILKVRELHLISESEEAGVYIVASRDGRQMFVTGHCEYDRDTLSREYFRDLAKGLNPQLPRHYFPGDDVEAEPQLNWRGHASLLFINWLNYYVYQSTPYDLNDLMPDEQS
ncbi:MAG: homoserine O-succinyltransferase, partial [Clostridiales bacterium]|nr:homoserine O-succinyltransferase [Clostridiales bacterium]